MPPSGKRRIDFTLPYSSGVILEELARVTRQGQGTHLNAALTNLLERYSTRAGPVAVPKVDGPSSGVNFDTSIYNFERLQALATSLDVKRSVLLREALFTYLVARERIDMNGVKTDPARRQARIEGPNAQMYDTHVAALLKQKINQEAYEASDERSTQLLVRQVQAGALVEDDGLSRAPTATCALCEAQLPCPQHPKTLR